MKSYFTVLCILVLFIATTFTTSIAQLPWTKNATNPLLGIGPAGSWNDVSLSPGCILFDGSIYHLWYGGNDGAKVRIGYATSPDGISWTEYAGNPVLDVGAAGTWEDEQAYIPYVISDGSIYHMWYSGYDGTNTRIGYATSSDGISWIKNAGNPLLNPGVSGSWDDMFVESPCVLFDGNNYHLWYTGGESPHIFRIGYATSPDGVIWTKHAGNPALDLGAVGSWDNPRVQYPDVLFDGEKYHMWYTGATEMWAWRIGYATSSDGIQWTKYADNPVLNVGAAGSWDDQWVGFARVLLDTTTSEYKMWYGGKDAAWVGVFGHATAPLNINVPADVPTIQAAIDASSDGNIVLVDEGTYYENINFKGKAITVASHYFMDGDTSHISKTIIDGSKNTDPDSGSVVYLVSGEDTTSVLMGFTITNGTGTKGQYTYGGVKYDSRDGGGIACWNSGGRFVSNKIINNTISSNTEAFGGGVGAGDFGSDAWVILENNHIINNTVSGLNGAFGGGVGLTFYGKLFDNIISYNSCYATEDDAAGGGVYFGTEPSKPRTVLIEGNYINHNFVKGKGTPAEDNWAAQGGGISAYASKVLILNNEISHNQLKDFGTGIGSGGGIYMYLATNGSVISGNTIYNNKNEVTDDKYGGGIGLGTTYGLSITNNLIYGNSASQGGGIRLRDFYSEIINNTIANNTASTSGGGLYSYNSNPVVVNTILWGNEAPNGPQISGNATVRYSDIQGSYSGTGNINADPLFVDTLKYNLSVSSPCIGAGIDSIKINSSWYIYPPTDIAGDTRPHYRDKLVDIGADESPYIVTGITAEELLIPGHFALHQNYPNPFNPSTMINYQLPMNRYVDLSIYNILGQKVKTLVSQKQQAGTYQVEWDATGFASGIYYYKLVAGDYMEVKKMILLR